MTVWVRPLADLCGLAGVDQRGRPPREGRYQMRRPPTRSSAGVGRARLVVLGHARATMTTSHLVAPKPLFYSAVDDVCVARPLDLSSDEKSDGHARIMLTLPPVEH